MDPLDLWILFGPTDALSRNPRTPRSIAVMVELTSRAQDALLASQTAARRFDPEAHIRLTADGAMVRQVLASRPEPGDAVLEVGALTIFVAPGVTGTVDAGEHNELTTG